MASVCAVFGMEKDPHKVSRFLYWTPHNGEIQIYKWFIIALLCLNSLIWLYMYIVTKMGKKIRAVDFSPFWNLVHILVINVLFIFAKKDYGVTSQNYLGVFPKMRQQGIRIESISIKTIFILQRSNHLKTPENVNCLI